MAFLTANDIHTHLYAGVVDEINREDETILNEAIAAGVEEVKGYLTAYDIDTIFNPAQPTDRNPVILMYAKDITVWHYIQLANPAIDIELRLKRYEQAIRQLEKVQSGKFNPSLPLLSTPEPALQQNFVKYGGIERRGNNF